MADFAPQVAALAGGVPVALLPVRLEARFVGSELRVRIFPDQIHVDAHEPELTAAERAAGIAYWTQRFAEPKPAARTSSPWTALCGVLGPARAAWVVQALTPKNASQIGKTPTPAFPDTPQRPGDWSRAARATALPERWVVIGQQGGREIFRKWTNAVADTLDVTVAPDDDAAPPPTADALPLQASARWLIDFDEAERAGMAVRIGAADVAAGQSLAAGLDRLLVLGVDWTLTPAKAAAAIRQLLATHVYTDGLSALDPGTPTNVTATAPSGGPPASDALAPALDPEQHPSSAAVAGAASDRLLRALGIKPSSRDLLTAIPGATTREQDVASHLANALWESSLGAYLTDFLNPLFPDAASAVVREHVRRHLFPGGPFPAVRVGRQPYAILPVVASRRFTPSADGRFETELSGLLGRLRPFWDAGVARAPRLGRSSNVDTDLAALLQTTPLSATFRFRPVLGPLAVSAARGFETHASAQERITELVGSQLRWPRRPDIAGFTAHPRDYPLRVPLVDVKPIVPGARLTTNYLRDIAALARSSGTYDAIKAREDASTLLEALVAHAVARELHRADMRTIDGYRVTSGLLTALPDVSLMRASEFVAIEAVARPAVGAGVAVTAPSQASRLVIPTVTGQQTVRQFVTSKVQKGTTSPPDYQALGDVLASLEWLSARPAEQLDRALRGMLDTYAYRLDAWYTSLATRRLAALRTATPTGVHLGAYGWLDDLRPRGAASSQGFVHAPSLPQAATAAVLRSGHLAHDDAEHSALQLDLTSARVRTALQLLDGVAQGQPLAALLGYRFERAVRMRGLTLAQYILPFRRLAPLRPDGGTTAADGPSEAIAARDVVDGVALLDRWRRATLLDALQPAPPPADQAALAQELDRLADLYDAVADVMVAEAVHQNVVGNNERAGAVLAALDRQERPPRMDFVRTPRTGTSFTHRLLVLIGDELLPASWAIMPTDARGAAEPRLNAWIARLIGDPTRIKFAGRASGTTQALTVTLRQLGLSPLSLVMAAQATGHDAQSELEERVVQLMAAQVQAPTPQTELTLLDAPPAGSTVRAIGLGAFRALMRQIYALITTQRPATAADLALPQDAGDERLDDAQLGARAAALATSFGQALAALDALIAKPSSTEAALRKGLWTAAAFGMAGAVPEAPPIGASDPAYRQRLRAQASAASAAMHTASSREHALAADSAATPRQRVVQHSARIRALLGEHFPVLPRFTVASASELTGSNAARTTLCAGDPLAPAAWLQRMGLVRPGADRLARVRGAAELLRSDVTPADLVLAQLPHVAGERWLALPFDGAAPAAQLAVVAQWSGAVDFTAPLAGLFCDAWPEVVPSREETTGIAFHFDAPGARPPQAVLLAVPAEAASPAWSVDALLDTVIEAHDLARIRAVGPRQLEWLGTVLPAVYLPTSFSTDVPTVNLAALAAKYTAANSTILGKG